MCDRQDLTWTGCKTVTCIELLKLRDQSSEVEAGHSEVEHSTSLATKLADNKRLHSCVFSVLTENLNIKKQQNVLDNGTNGQ